MRKVWARWRIRLALFAMVAGPGIITANVDNDAGGIATYSVAGAKFGYRLLWVLPPTCVLLVLIQEMCSRMGVVTGKGLSGLIRESFGLKVSFYLMVALIVTNFGNGLADFAGVVGAARIFGIPSYFAAPLSAFVLWHTVVKGTYRSVEKWFFLACGFYITYIISGFLAKPAWSDALRGSALPSLQTDSATLYMIVGIVGTTIAPWMQFYQQASAVEKGIPLKHYRYARLDTIFGAIIVTVVCYFIVLACAATLHKAGTQVQTAADAAKALFPIAGTYCGTLFAIGLLAASHFGATILPISTATSVCEAMGWERGVDKRFHQAPQYYLIYTLFIVAGAGLAATLPEKLLIPVMLLSQVLNGMLLPVVVFFMLRITNDKGIMGDYTNGPLFNVIAWTGAGLLAVMSIVLAVLTAINA
jgi:NRAMP (natural resistance-associated macrophage protein)-like metal ion transporter